MGGINLCVAVPAFVWAIRWAERLSPCPNSVDPFPFDANFTGTRVINNQIISDGAFIHMAV